MGKKKHIISKVKDKLLHLVLPIAKKEAHFLVDLLMFWA